MRGAQDNSGMETYFIFMLAAVGVLVLKSRDQRRRITLLGSHLSNYQIEKLMETLAEGYDRALGEQDPNRQDQVLALMQSHETALASQFRRLAADIARVDAAQVLISTLPLALPHADRLFPSSTFALGKAFDIHARGFERAVENEAGRSPRERAFLLSAEMYLMQHTCHWFCKSRTIASARLLARHKTSHEQVLEAVSPETRRAYRELTGI